MNKKNIIIGSIIAVLAILLITSFLWNRDVRNKLRIAQHNVEAALDSIRYLKDANGNLYAEKKSFIATISELKELNTEMYENIQSLQKKLQKKILAGSDIGSRSGHHLSGQDHRIHVRQSGKYPLLRSDHQCQQPRSHTSGQYPSATIHIQLGHSARSLFHKRLSDHRSQ